MPFLLQRIRFGIRHAMHRNGGRVDFGRLPFAGRRFDFAGHTHAATGRKPLDFRFVIWQAAFGDCLNIAKTGAVVEFQKTKPGL